MKLAIAFFALALAGCSTPPVQRMLDGALPPNFKGSARLEHKNPYGKIIIAAEGLERLPAGWVWTYLSWTREGMVSNGSLVVGKSGKP